MLSVPETLGSFMVCTNYYFCVTNHPKTHSSKFLGSMGWECGQARQGLLSNMQCLELQLGKLRWLEVTQMAAG